MWPGKIPHVGHDGAPRRWEDCRSFIHNPGKALAEVQQQLHARMQQVTQMEEERSRYLRGLAEKGQERGRFP